MGGNPPYWGYGNDPTDDVPVYPIFAYSLTLRSKTLQGSGMSAASWLYDYSPNIGYVRYPGTTEEYPVCPYGTSTQCEQPICTSESCAGSSVTTVQEPEGRWRRFYYGNTYRYNEGKLLKEEVGTGAQVLRTTTYTYDLSRSDAGYLARFGTSLKLNGDGFQSEYHRPQLRRDIAQEGVIYSKTATALDEFARPVTTERFNSLGYARADTTGYFDQRALWVLGQVNRSECIAPADCVGDVMFSVDYDASSALPVRTYKFGGLDQTLSYHADGTVAAVSDARTAAGTDTTVHLANWKRGYPQLITYATGHAKQTVVSDAGWVVSETDENGYTSTFAYDAMGRLRQINYPTGDTTEWLARQLEFRASTTADALPAGVAVGQWLQQVTQGNYRKTTYFDAMWRPVLTQEYDAADRAGTLRAISQEYDALGREAFESYPSRDPVPPAIGEWTFHDPLDRVTESRRDSELGQLVTRTEYLAGNQSRVTNPEGAVTLTAYDAYDEPKYDLPTSIDMPEGIRTEIDRDVHGSPLRISRMGVSP